MHATNKEKWADEATRIATETTTTLAEIISGEENTKTNATSVNNSMGYKGSTEMLSTDQGMGTDRIGNEEGMNPLKSVDYILKGEDDKAKKEPKNKKKLDQYGFITNLDDQGLLRDDLFPALPGSAYTPPTSSQKKELSAPRQSRLKKKLLRRREKKWLDMLASWDSILVSQQKYKKMRSRVRKGIPNSVRGRAWAAISKATQRTETEAGVYNHLVGKSCSEVEVEVEYDNDSNKNWYDGNHVPAKLSQTEFNGNVITKETIERDINRTFPRHSMFYDSVTDSDSCEESTDVSFDQISEGGSLILEADDFDDGHIDKEDSAVPLWATGVIQETSDCSKFHKEQEAGVEVEPLLGLPTQPKRSKSLRRMKKESSDLTIAKGGQASLRRVLRAYSIYDADVGYCQGMNFIAAMFITFVSEEQAFWLLVAVMQDSPCRMRGLFGEGMTEAHQVLFVAQKLIAQFLPRLSRHFERENVDITMYATQWLLTMYTSAFPFDIVTRLWDCFLVEGWKVAYRVMLALLDAGASDLMKLRFEGILGYLKELPNIVECDALFQATFKIPLRKKHISRYAKQWEKAQTPTHGASVS